MEAERERERQQIRTVESRTTHPSHATSADSSSPDQQKCAPHKTKKVHQVVYYQPRQLLLWSFAGCAAAAEAGGLDPAALPLLLSSSRGMEEDLTPPFFCLPSDEEEHGR